MSFKDGSHLSMPLLRRTERLLETAVLEDLRRGEHSWWFTFSSGSLQVEHIWRLLEQGLLVVTDREDGLAYGEASPIDAQDAARTLLVGRRVLSAMINPETADLSIAMEGGVRLEVLTVSARTEAWSFDAPDFCVAAACGRLSEPGWFLAPPASSTPA